LVEVVDSHTGTTKVPVGKSSGGKKKSWGVPNYELTMNNYEL
jgi:hypothetical protein